MREMTSQEGRVLLVVTPTQFRDEEVFQTRSALEKAGARVRIGSLATRTCHGMLGGTIEADVAIADAQAGDFDALVLAGGSSVPTLFWKDKALGALVSAMAESGKVVAAIGLSTVVLAKAGLLEGKRATVYYLPEALEELNNAGAKYVREPVVVEGRLITAEGPGSVNDLASALSDALALTPAGATAS
jgi:deglycase